MARILTVATAFLLFGLLPVTVGATTYEIREFRQESGGSFVDYFDSGSPPPEGPSWWGSPSYFTMGTFLSGDEHDDVLDLVTSQGFADPGDDRVIAALTAGNYFSLGTVGYTEGHFRNLAPLLGEGYGIIIQRPDDTDDEALLVVYNDSGTLVAVFSDEGPAPLGTYLLSGMDGTGEIGLTLDLDDSGAVTAWIDTGSGYFNPFGVTTTTLGTLGEGTHTGGFGAFEPVPEPGTLLLLGSSLVGLGAWARRRKKAISPFLSP